MLQSELNEKEGVRKFGKTESSVVRTKPISLYNLDLVFASGYKVNSKKGIEFRKLVSKVLKSIFPLAY